MNRRSEIVMSDDEVRALLDRPLTMTVCTFGRDHTIHAVPVFYGFLDGDVAFHTKSKSQKIRNLGRDDAITCSVHAGVTTEELCGVTIIGRAVVTDDEATLRALNEDVIRRYATEPGVDAEAVFEAKLRKRVAVRVPALRVISFDHAKVYRTDSPTG